MASVDNIGCRKYTAHRAHIQTQYNNIIIFFFFYASVTDIMSLVDVSLHQNSEKFELR